MTELIDLFLQCERAASLPPSRRSAVAGPRDWDVSEKEFRRRFQVFSEGFQYAFEDSVPVY